MWLSLMKFYASDYKRALLSVLTSMNTPIKLCLFQHQPSRFTIVYCMSMTMQEISRRVTHRGLFGADSEHDGRAE